MRTRNFTAGIAAAVLLAGSAHADEGMWTFDNFPAAAVQAKYNVTIDKAWLDKVQAASVRLSTGCSASIVSNAGLVLTNHHCIRACAQQLSTPQADYVKDGFQASRRADEKLCPGMQAEILTAIADVSERVRVTGAGKSGQEFVRARDAEIAAIEKAGCAGREALFRCQVVTLYQGGQYKLYTYRKYADVRLVAAPELDSAFFGGDPDNFSFPRYCLDFAFVRLYQNNAPIASPQHLSWSAAPPIDGAPAFVSGNPGTTQRLLTAEQLETLRDVALPATLLMYAELRGRLIRFGAESAEHGRIVDDTLFGIENSFKSLSGQQKALINPTLITAKRAADQELRRRVAGEAALAADIGDPWADVASAQTQWRVLYAPYTFQESRAGFRSLLFSYARSLVRAAQEKTRPNGERLLEYSDGQLPLLEKRVLDAQPVYPELEKLALEFWLSKLRETLTADNAGTKTFLGKDSPEMLAARLSQSRLGDPLLRKALWDGGLAAITASDDPMIRFVLATDAASRAVRNQYETRVSGPVDRAQQKIAQARFAVYGTNTYPDASFSLRLSYGQVKGWTANGETVGAFTRFGGLWERATGQFPFALAPRWAAGQSKVNANTVFNFVTDNDIAGGNSGSPVIDAQARVIGTAFDSTLLSLGGSFGYDPALNRTVSVSTAAITEALEKIYGNTALVAELTGR